MYRKIQYEVSDRLALVRLNRPEKRNALDREIISEMRDAFANAEMEASVRAILLAAEGSDFSAGADLDALKQISQMSILENAADARHLADLFVQMRHCAKPIVAAVRGRALGGGCGLATACDLVVAAESAQFGYPEVTIGFVPAIVTPILRRSISEKAAFELITMGEVITAARALELGLIHRVFPDATFDQDVEAYLARLAGKPASAVELTKRLLYHVDAMPFETAMETGVQTNAIARMTEDCRRGIAKFLEK